MTAIRNRRHRRRLILALGTVTLLLVAGVLVLSGPSDATLLQDALDAGRLASLPPGAAEIEIAGTRNMFSWTTLFRFTAPAAEIDAFINGSPSLQAATPMMFDASTPYLPYSRAEPSSRRAQHDCFHLDSRYPWWDPTIRESGRRYEIRQDAQAHWGEVIVNDATNVVYIRISRS
jgi:hypothetical protein